MLFHEVVVFVFLAGMTVNVIALSDLMHRLFCCVVNPDKILPACSDMPAIYVPHLSALLSKIVFPEYVHPFVVAVPGFKGDLGQPFDGISFLPVHVYAVRPCMAVHAESDR